MRSFIKHFLYLNLYRWYWFLLISQTCIHFSLDYDLASYTLCTLILDMSCGTYSLKSTVRVLARNLLKNHRKNIFYISFWCLTWGLISSLTSTKPTHYLLGYSNFLAYWCHMSMQNWSLQPISQDYDLISGTTYVVYVNFIYKWRDLQFNVVCVSFNYTQSFSQKSAEGKSPKKYFLYIV